MNLKHAQTIIDGAVKTYLTSQQVTSESTEENTEEVIVDVKASPDAHSPSSASEGDTCAQTGRKGGETEEKEKASLSLVSVLDALEKLRT